MSTPPDWSRWPLLLTSLVLIFGGIGLLSSGGALEFAGFAAALLGGPPLGAFIVLEARRSP